MNNTNSTKYNLPPELVEKKSLDKKMAIILEIYMIFYV